MRKGEVCGACTGALMVLGIMFGQSDKNDMISREKANKMTDLFFERFKEINGTYIYAGKYLAAIFRQKRELPMLGHIGFLLRLVVICYHWQSGCWKR